MFGDEIGRHGPQPQIPNRAVRPEPDKGAEGVCLLALQFPSSKRCVLETYVLVAEVFVGLATECNTSLEPVGGSA